MLKFCCRSALVASALTGLAQPAARACDDEIQSFAPSYGVCAEVPAPEAVLIRRAPVAVYRQPQRALAVHRAPAAFVPARGYGYGSPGRAFAPGGGGGGISAGRKVVIKNSQVDGLGGTIDAGRKVKIRGSRVGF